MTVHGEEPRGEAGVLGLAAANAVIAAALGTAAELDLPPLTVVVLDASGHLLAAQRQDGASMFRFDVALGKAWGAVALGSSSRGLAELAEANPNFFGALASTAGGRLLPQPGAVLVRRQDGTVLGAVGASGASGTEDEQCCAAGVRAVGFVVDRPGVPA